MQTSHRYRGRSICTNALLHSILPASHHAELRSSWSTVLTFFRAGGPPTQRKKLTKLSCRRPTNAEEEAYSLMLTGVPARRIAIILSLRASHHAELKSSWPSFSLVFLRASHQRSGKNLFHLSLWASHLKFQSPWVSFYCFFTQASHHCKWSKICTIS